MIILLTGPTGCGKTDTSWALLQQFDQMVFLDSDWFASRIPFSWEKEEDVESIYQALSVMLDFYIKKRKQNFVIPITYEMAILYKTFQHYLLKENLKIKGFRLRCSEQELERRIKERDRIHWQKQQELNCMLQVQNDFDRNFTNDAIFKLIDTTTLSERETAIKITDIANNEK